MYEQLLVHLRLQRQRIPKIAHGINASIQKIKIYLTKARKTHVYVIAMGMWLPLTMNQDSDDTSFYSHQSSVQIQLDREQLDFGGAQRCTQLGQKRGMLDTTLPSLCTD